MSRTHLTIVRATGWAVIAAGAGAGIALAATAARTWRHL